MLLSDSAEALGRQFAEQVIEEDWQALAACFSDSAGITAEKLEECLAWKTLATRLKDAFAEETGVTDLAELSPPAAHETWNDVCRDNDYGPQPIVQVGQCVAADDEGQGPFIQIDFLPDEQSGFDHCYRCVLTIADGDQPHVSGFEIELILD